MGIGRTQGLPTPPQCSPLLPMSDLCSIGRGEQGANGSCCMLALVSVLLEGALLQVCWNVQPSAVCICTGRCGASLFACSGVFVFNCYLLAHTVGLLLPIQRPFPKLVTTGSAPESHAMQVRVLCSKILLVHTVHAALSCLLLLLR